MATRGDPGQSYSAGDEGENREESEDKVSIPPIPAARSSNRNRTPDAPQDAGGKRRGSIMGSDLGGVRPLTMPLSRVH